MHTAEYLNICHTCAELESSTAQYEAVDTYNPTEEDSTVSDKILSGEFRTLEISLKKQRIRELNKLVEKWR